MSVPLARLLEALGRSSADQRPIAAVADDSRAVVPGALFVAVAGLRVDGNAFVGDAVRAGAVAVVYDAARPAPDVPAGVVAIGVDDPRRAASRLAARFFGDPSRALTVVGITGTNGKTTTTHLVAAILARAGIPCACVGTLGVEFAGRTVPLANTTPPAIELQRTLARLRDDGARAVAMEVSSHALALGRVDDVAFAAGAFTNLTRDHLDFHGTLDAYAAAKRRLFDLAAFAVLNADDPFGARWASELRAQQRACATYGIDAPDADVRAEGVASTSGASAFSVDGRRFELALPGRFNVENALAALTIARRLGVDDAIAAEAFAQSIDVPGRMQTVRAGEVVAIVDYAHTPDALARVLTASREIARGRLSVVFGCGGDRDRGKRPEMGRIAEALADRVVVTSDNPRGERPDDIIDEIVAGVSDRTKVERVTDRRDAIWRAISAARPGDVVVIAGKGHETYQIVADRTLPFDDVAVVRAAFAARSESAPV